jgi:membrane protein YdbS with pleckstrin-like domain
MANSSSSSSGVGFFGLLQVAFIVLKVTNLINWTWFWVFSPTWISGGIIVLILLVMLVLFGIKSSRLKR